MHDLIIKAYKWDVNEVFILGNFNYSQVYVIIRNRKEINIYENHFDPSLFVFFAGNYFNEVLYESTSRHRKDQWI